ncbi:MAG: bifunctional adenosylcobinamide kinase/adenosylcobinamide-phosphate guanylyltransferase [Anaerolineae bacterium UTCFX2]|jgi:adenosylcobinamide kinase/adenosylcobinamide-phosphate guanylyltransferase|nr:bifunctional adenosylcobinamide kinase/adenosylcobinamide-phosphate guanylyltransferase [Anaerolineales bacterium]OQY90131.1 MAG: bifunctional adenosylcobinamide kinase/adenosylcobinamide-phosphate guanylyltransferase [Anaerolineae bacterium UTCFX2]
MGRLTLILGGARSGKSAYAESLALQYAGSVTYVATAQALDPEMLQRIAVHRQARPAAWVTREIPLGVGQALLADPPQAGLVILDCLTLLVSNLLMQICTPAGELDETAAVALVDAEIESLLNAVRQIPADFIIVSNEVGLGLVPPYPLGRVYRDLLGRANQRLAAQASQVIFIIAGIPMKLTPL